MSEDGSNSKPKAHQLNPRRRKKFKQSKADLTPEELKRRQEQQRRREIALKLRAEGRTYNPRVFKRKQFSDGGPAHKKVRVKVKSSQRNKQPYHVVILPIAWKQRREESASIDAACAAAAQHLREAGITLTIDETDIYTPGQKMKFWEQRGVKVRLEIGPKEALAGTAILALATTPGQVAQKQSVKVKPDLLVAKVKEALEKQGVDLSGLQPGAGSGGGNVAGAGGGAAGDLQADGQQKQQAKSKKRSAEELGQQQAGAEKDAAGAAAAEDAELQDAQQAKKKKKKKQLVEDGQQAQAVAEQMALAGGGAQQQQTAKQQKQKQPAQVHHQQQEVQVPVKQQKQQQQQHTGDGLEDDFGELLDEPVVASGKASKKQKPKKQREGGGGAAAGGFGASLASQPKPAGTKKQKVVKF